MGRNIAAIGVEFILDGIAAHYPGLLGQTGHLTEETLVAFNAASWCIALGTLNVWAIFETTIQWSGKSN